MSHFPPKGQVLLVSDGSIGNGVYTPAATSNPLYVSGTTRVRFFVQVVTIAGSALANVTVKLQQRYSETQPQALPARLDRCAEQRGSCGHAEPAHPQG